MSMPTGKITGKIQDSCKVCQLSMHPDKELKNLFVEIEKRVLDLGFQQKDVIAYANAQLELYNNARAPGEDPIALFNATNFSRHFKNHISPSRLIAQKINDDLVRNTSGNMFKKAADLPTAELFGKKSNEKYIADYIALSNLNDQIQSYISKFVAHINQKALEDDFSDVNMRDINEYQVALRNLVETRQKLSQMQNSQAVAGLALTDSNMRVSKALLEIINKTLQGVKEEFALNGQLDLFETIYTTIFQSLDEEFEAQLEAIDKRIRKEYGIS